MFHKGPGLEKIIGQIRPPICPATYPVIIEKRSSFSAAQLTLLTCVSLDVGDMIITPIDTISAEIRKAQ